MSICKSDHKTTLVSGNAHYQHGLQMLFQITKCSCAQNPYNCTKTVFFLKKLAKQKKKA